MEDASFRIVTFSISLGFKAVNTPLDIGEPSKINNGSVEELIEPAEETAAEKKTTRRTTKKEATAEVYIQFMGREVYTKNILSNVRRIWTDELGKKEKDLKDIKIYIKPEENKAYYVINGDITGSVWI